MQIPVHAPCAKAGNAPREEIKRTTALSDPAIQRSSDPAISVLHQLLPLIVKIVQIVTTGHLQKHTCGVGGAEVGGDFGTEGS
jgi:hypothetical protein